MKGSRISILAILFISLGLLLCGCGGGNDDGPVVAQMPAYTVTIGDLETLGKEANNLL